MATSTPGSPIGLFLSYAPEDIEYREKLEKHLKPLQDDGLLSLWHDGKIGAGEEPKPLIEEHMQSAKIIILLVSADFLASDPLRAEMEKAMERHKDGKARVIPVILRACEWKGALFGKLRPLPNKGKPVGDLQTNKDDAFAEIVRGIRKVVEELRASSRSASTPASSQTGREATDASGTDTVRDPEPTAVGRPVVRLGRFALIISITITITLALILALLPGPRGYVAQVLHLDERNTRIPTATLHTGAVTPVPTGTPPNAVAPSPSGVPAPSATMMPAPIPTIPPSATPAPEPTFTPTARPTNTAVDGPPPTEVPPPTLATATSLPRPTIPAARTVTIRIEGMSQAMLDCSKLCFFQERQPEGTACESGEVILLAEYDARAASIISPIAHGWFRFQGSEDKKCPWEMGGHFTFVTYDPGKKVPLDGQDIVIEWTTGESEGSGTPHPANTVRPTSTP